MPQKERDRAKCGFHTKTYCFQWSEDYFDDPRPTLLVLNTGAHMRSRKHTTTEFEGEMAEFAAWFGVRQKKRSNSGGGKDLLVYRTATGGHLQCHRYLKPYTRAEQYRITPHNDWDLFRLYNAIARAAMAELPVLFVDVRPMTELRPDGHRSKRDCLHYSLPGPPDWWNHLMFSALLEEFP